MAQPTTQFRDIPTSTATTAVDTPAERVGAISGQDIVSTGAGNEWDFGVVDITGGANQSAVRQLVWNVTAYNGSTQVSNFRVFFDDSPDHWGFQDGATVFKIQDVSGADVGSPANTENYVANAVVGSYTWANVSKTEAGANVVYAADDTASIVPATSNDVVMLAGYLAVAAGEVGGTYVGTTSGLEFRLSFKYDYQ